MKINRSAAIKAVITLIVLLGTPTLAVFAFGPEGLLIALLGIIVGSIAMLLYYAYGG